MIAEVLFLFIDLFLKFLFNLFKLKMMNKNKTKAKPINSLPVKPSGLDFVGMFLITVSVGKSVVVLFFWEDMCQIVP